MTKAQLQVAYDALKAENDALRAHVCPPPVTIHKFPALGAASGGFPMVMSVNGEYQYGAPTIGMAACAGAAPLHAIQTYWVTT